MHLCFVFRGTPGLFRAGPPLPWSPSLFRHSPDPPYTPDLASADFRGLPYSSEPLGLRPLAIFGLPHTPWLSQASLPLPITSDTFPTSAGLAPPSTDTFRPPYLPQFVSDRSRPFFSSENLFFLPWLPLKRKVAATPLLLPHPDFLFASSTTFRPSPALSLAFRSTPLL